MKKTFLFITIFSLMIASAFATPGAIWTTTDSCGNPQNENHYNRGDVVYINFENFPLGLTSWDITGKPGGASCDPDIAVVTGNANLGGNGNGCFAAYTIAQDDCGEYTATLGNKHDNYRVNDNEVPEFTTIAAGLALIGAGVVVLRKRR